MRRRVHGRPDAGAGGDRPARAFRGRSRHRRRLDQSALHRAQRLQGRHRRLRSGRDGLRRRHGQGRLRRYGVRGISPGGRRAQVRYPRFPPPQRGGRRRDPQPLQARRQVRVQHACRAPVHDRADDRRDGIPRGLHRHRGGLPGDARHSRRLAQRRALSERAPDTLQSDAREGVPELRHAAATRSTRGRRRRRQYGDGRDARVPPARRREGLLHLSPQSHRVSGAQRRSPPCRRGRGRIPLAHQSGRNP